MTDAATLDAYGALTAPATVRIQRLLPGPIDRVWAYLADSRLRGQWLATGDMDLRPGGKVALTWRNDQLTGLPEQRPAGFPETQSMESQVVEVDVPNRLTLSWGVASEVTFELAPQAGEVLLTITHRRLPAREDTLNVSAGWHTHLDILVARLRGQPLKPFWTTWAGLKAEYARRIAG